MIRPHRSLAHGSGLSHTHSSTGLVPLARPISVLVTLVSDYSSSLVSAMATGTWVLGTSGIRLGCTNIGVNSIIIIIIILG